MFLPALLNDGDTLWQIRTGQWILAHHAIPATDPFSFTAGDRRWFPHEWLAETLMALAYQAAGMRGIMVLAAGALGVTAGLIAGTARRFLPGIYATVALAVALMNAAPSILARPHLLAWPCLTLWCTGLIGARGRGAAPSFWLLPVMLVWVNLHGSFMVGLLLPAAFLLEALLDPGVNRRQVLLSWSGFIAAAWLTALCNPAFLSGLLFPFHMLGMHSLAWVGEWEPTNFAQIQPLELVILAALALCGSGRLTLPPIRLLLFLGLIHAALSHGRNEQLLGLAGTIILVEPLGRALGRGAAAPIPRFWTAAAFALALAAVGARFVAPPGPDRGGAAIEAALDQLPPGFRTKPVLNEYGLGAGLIWHGVRPFIDSRADLYGDAFLTRYRLATWPDRAALDALLADFRIAWTIFPSGHPILSTLDSEPGWRRAIDAGGFVIHTRTE